MLAWVVQLWRVAGAVWLLLACHTASAIQVFESGVEAADQTPVFWISPDEVLFSAPSGEYFNRSDGFRKPVTRLTTWNLRTKETKRFNEVDAGLCYYNGNIAFWEIDNALPRQWTSIGRFPGEIKRFEGEIAFDRLTCLPVESRAPLPDWAKERSVMRLRPEHGFLDLGPQREPKNLPVRLIRNDGAPIELPIRRREFVQAEVRYYPHKGGYFFPGHLFRVDARHPWGGIGVGPWPREKPRPVQWLYPDGSVEHFLVPPAKWISDMLVPTKAGVVALDSTFFTITGEAPWDGLYVLDPKGWSPRFSRGLFRAPALSEDGCRLAVRRQPEPGKRRPEYWTVTVYDVCRTR
jgi:hypothetical protein